MGPIRHPSPFPFRSRSHNIQSNFSLGTSDAALAEEYGLDTRLLCLEASLVALA
jgi:hypothetical protein